MPSLVKITVDRAVDLPIMDTSDMSTDAYVQVELKDQDDIKTYKTSTCRKDLNPVWGESTQFEVTDDSSLQDSPVEFKVFDQGFSASELIGIVYIDLNPLIMRTATMQDGAKDLIIQGFFPLFDASSLKGSRGSLKVIVKLQFIGNDNPFRDSSAGVQFFSSSTLSNNSFVIKDILGFVADLIVEDDAESRNYFNFSYKGDNARLKALYNLSAYVRREVGKKVLEAGGNAVLGYSSHFDFEDASCVVVRAYGTICRLLKVGNSIQQLVSGNDIRERRLSNGEELNVHFEASNVSEIMSPLTKEGNSFSIDNVVGIPLLPFGPSRDLGSTTFPSMRHKASVSSENEVQILTLMSFEKHIRIRLGGLVMARSVKFLGKLEATISDQETREGWWEELRDEIKKHAKTMCCSHIVGYSESCTIYGDMCILSAVGTGATIKKLSHPNIVTSNMLNQQNMGDANGEDDYDDDQNEVFLLLLLSFYNQLNVSVHRMTRRPASIPLSQWAISSFRIVKILGNPSGSRT